MFDITYSRKLILGFSVAALLIVAIGGAALSSNRILADAKSWESHAQEVILKLESISSSMKDSELANIRYQNTHNVIYLEDFRRSGEIVRTKIQDLRVLTADNPEQIENIQELESMAEKWTGLSDEILKPRSRDGLESWGEILGTIELMKRLEQRLFEVRGKNSELQVQISQGIIYTSIAFHLLLLALLFRILKAESIKRKDTESVLFEKKGLLELILNSMADGVVALDEEKRIFLHNARVMELVGDVPNNNTRWEDWIRSNGFSIAKETDAELFNHNGKQSNFFEMERSRFLLQGGKKIGSENHILEINSRTMKDRGGEKLGNVVLLSDVTERSDWERQIKDLNNELNKNLKKAEIANRELEAFSYSVSHDLRSPIRGIDGFTKILTEDYSAVLDAEGRRILGVIMDSAKIMGQLIDDLLAFYRVSKNEPKTDRLDMNRLVKDCIISMKQNGSISELEIKVEDLPYATGDTSMVKQVIFNLLSNASKYSSKVRNAMVRVGGVNGGNENTYFVQDNGVGFNSQYSHKLFKIFQRLHSPEEFEGTGIGLAIVERIVSRHGGRVWAEGETNRGATFYFTLPSGAEL
ncbi:GHKL domain protein [Leptospira fainei serovar Hurstbridge str. BUT 6]|uniref:histidine kinase n=2 Tax=Leptospira fainei TaxID=48782 RepID=S3UYN6_9LEPT|nr:GHKL domain protein [Leptospira fainei serovar Hurstbridge str. BUT 6]